jgi:bifunctional DNase/RNase
MDDQSLVEMSVVKVSPYLQVERPLLWLCEKSTVQPRLLPIAIGQFEAAAIQMQLDQDEPLRPISYDLLATVLNRLSVPVRRVVIHTARKQIYYARIAIEKDGLLREVDSRPSDAIALALRTGAPVYVTGELLELVGYKTEEGETQIEHAIERFSALEPQLSSTKRKVVAASAKTAIRERPGADLLTLAAEPAPPADLLSQLQAKLEQAVICEEYEEAAKLRDEIELLVNRTKA